MSDIANQAAGNEPPIVSVSELSGAIKHIIEDRFGFVRLRAEISGFKRAASGHLYMTLKDADSAIDGVCWRGSAGKLDVVPEDGLEVIVSGRVTTYAARSKYQFVIERMEMAGEGALLKMIEERRKKLAAEGLFDAERKRALPYLPEVIGVVTSPTGAVIRDILHRLADRFPRRVLLWPVLVQGNGAAGQVAAAIRGFNGFQPGGTVPRPDLLIVARGGGSLEDLMAFNEEIVVRAAAESDIPLISAVGHETDTTLIDFASDRRAPTPTAAAEMAVPVRGELIAQVSERGARLVGAATRLLREQGQQVAGLARGLPRPQQLIEAAAQRADDFGERLDPAMKRYLADRGGKLRETQLPKPGIYLQQKVHPLKVLEGRLQSAGTGLRRAADRDLKTVDALGGRLATAWPRYAGRRSDRLDSVSKLLDSYSYKGVLERGFVLVRDADGQPVLGAEALAAGDAIDLTFRDDRHVGAVVSGDAPPQSPGPAKPKPERAAAKPRAAKPAKAASDDPQGQLL
jgi:exodeoxyribonuclease VII large subunit